MKSLIRNFSYRLYQLHRINRSFVSSASIDASIYHHCSCYCYCCHRSQTSLCHRNRSTWRRRVCVIIFPLGTIFCDVFSLYSKLWSGMWLSLLRYNIRFPQWFNSPFDLFSFLSFSKNDTCSDVSTSFLRSLTCHLFLLLIICIQCMYVIYKHTCIFLFFLIKRLKSKLYMHNYTCIYLYAFMYP